VTLTAITRSNTPGSIWLIGDSVPQRRVA